MTWHCEAPWSPMSWNDSVRRKEMRHFGQQLIPKVSILFAVNVIIYQPEIINMIFFKNAIITIYNWIHFHSRQISPEKALIKYSSNDQSERRSVIDISRKLKFFWKIKSQKISWFWQSHWPLYPKRNTENYIREYEQKRGCLIIDVALKVDQKVK